jgi:3-oxoadipate enol-lactonase
VERQSIETSWGRVGCTIRGAGGVPLLFLHGVGSNRSAWDGQVERFGAGRQTIAIDMPGYGNSEGGSGDPRSDFAAAALAVLDALEVPQAHVCGLSLGGVIALAMHARAPERIASLMLADTFACHPEGRAIYERSLAGAAELGMAGLAESRADALLAQPADPAVRKAVVDTLRDRSRSLRPRRRGGVAGRPAAGDGSRKVPDADPLRQRGSHHASGSV